MPSDEDEEFPDDHPYRDGDADDVLESLRASGAQVKFDRTPLYQQMVGRGLRPPPADRQYTVVNLPATIEEYLNSPEARAQEARIQEILAHDVRTGVAEVFGDEIIYKDQGPSIREMLTTVYGKNITAAVDAERIEEFTPKGLLNLPDVEVTLSGTYDAAPPQAELADKYPLWSLTIKRTYGPYLKGVCGCGWQTKDHVRTVIIAEDWDDHMMASLPELHQMPPEAVPVDVLDPEKMAAMPWLKTTCSGFREDSEAGPKWCAECGLRRHLHTDVSSEF